MAQKVSKTATRRRKNRGSQSKTGGGHHRPLRCEPLEDRRMLSVTLSQFDLTFILDQIEIAEAHAAGADLTTLIPNWEMALGLRTVDGSYNNLVPGRSEFGAADNVFPRLTTPVFGPAEAGTSYQQTSGTVIDSQVRLISNLIVDQTANNPAAVATAFDAGTDGVLGTADDVLKDGARIVSGTRADGTPFETFHFDNESSDEGLSASFNAWMTFFGQFFDHGLDLVTKGGSGTVFIPLQPDDPLFNPASPTNFMVLTRATNLPGADGILGNADDIHEHSNTTSPFVDQNQTYTSHPAHQVFLREYEFNAVGRPVDTGKLIVDRDLGPDGVFGTADDGVIGGMATWVTVKAQARDILGIELADADVLSVPLLATDPYGNFLPGANGFPQVVMPGPDGLLGTADDLLVEGNPAAPISLAGSVKTGHAFLDDIAHSAVPAGEAGVPLAPDADDVAGGPVEAGFYDNELLGAHYLAGDGRVNENIVLTAVHHVFHSEHNRLADHVKDQVLSSNNVSFLNSWLLVPVAAVPADPSTLEWNGQRLFQAAKFGTEMQYQHLVFEEFARTIQPNIDLFLDYDGTVDAAISAEFAHTVYRFGHSMLTETVLRMDPDFVPDEIGLIQAFLNPLEFAASGPTPEAAAGAIIRGVTRQAGNEIDEFVTEALRNNLLGLPLDLATINMARGRDTGVPSLNAARREFYAGTGDAQLRPYASWFDFVQHMKHPESLVNFIAAFGTHDSITNATTLAEKRDAATLLVFGGAGAPADRLNFLHSTGTWASGPDGVTTTGLDDIDFWVGGLAEQKMPFGGMLGSTFAFVFETQLEDLQNGDRFYYLHRNNGLDIFLELENNSFSTMIGNATDATHLPAVSFLMPTLNLEVDQTQQFNEGLGDADPVGDNPIVPLVIRDNPATEGQDTNYLQYTGADHVVLGGAAADEILIGGIGDDATYGDEGNDRIEGGHGNDFVIGGPGDDILTDIGGDDVLKGDEGNDVLSGGGGADILQGGYGNDFFITDRDDFMRLFGGPGSDFMLVPIRPIGIRPGEGDDWIEGSVPEGVSGDNLNPLRLDPPIGNDVFLAAGMPSVMNGEGGDDIFVSGSAGGERFVGRSGFDWATLKNSPSGVTMDMNLRALDAEPAPLTGLLARFKGTEGLSGSHFSDFLRGDDDTAAQIRIAGAQGSMLTDFDLIDGLREFLGQAGAGPDGILDTADDQFDAGNILLGGSGSDLIEGRGGDDLIDGNAWLNVRISVRANTDGTGPEIATYDSMTPLIPLMLDGTYNPGQLVIVREILHGADGVDFDTAIFSDVRANYDITTVDGVTTVTHLVIPGGGGGGGGGGGLNFSDGTDRLTNIERLQFSDMSVVLTPGSNAEPVGWLALSDITPQVGETITVSAAGITDADNVSPTNPTGAVTGPISYYWQYAPLGDGLFRDIEVVSPFGKQSAVGSSFTVPAEPAVAGLPIRVVGVYQDANGVLEMVTSTSAPVLDPIGNQAVDEGTELTFTAAASDPDLPLETLTFTLDAGAPAGATIDPQTGVFSWTPTEADGPGTFNVTVRVTDSGTPALDDFETITIAVNEVNLAPVLDPIGDQAVDEGVELTFAATANDTDLPLNTLTFSLDAGAPAGATINPVTGLFSWTPTEADGPGSYSVTIRVTDGGTPALDAFETITIAVNEVNAAPVLDPIGNQAVDEGVELTFTAVANDTDLAPNALTFSLDAASLAAGMTIDAVSGEFRWTPTDAQSGADYSVTITVTDDGTNPGPSSDAETFTITVAVGDRDYGDAPDLTYPTLLASNGARHTIVSGIHLGNSVDVDADGQPDAQALGDDNDGTNDEDGVRFLTRIVPGATAWIAVTASTAGVLNAWLDLNADGDWDNAGEHFAVDVALVAGVNQVPLIVPANAVVTSSTFARFRFSSQAGLDYRGWAPDGEVEDYEVEIQAAVRDDLAGLTSGGQWYVATSTGTAFSTASWGLWSAGDWTDVMSGDFNGDGQVDVVGRLDTRWYVGLSTGSSFVTTSWGLWDAGAWTDVLIGDFNGDGRDDVAGRLNNRWYVATSTGASFTTTSWGLWGAGTWSDVRVGDFDGDGKSDIAGRLNGTRWYVATSTGTSFNTTSWALWGAGTWTDVLVGDFNADGRSDITARLNGNRWYTSLSTGTSFNTSYWGLWGTATWNDVAVGDFNGDGRSDIAGRLNDGRWYVGLSAGASYSTTYWGPWGASTWNDMAVGDFDGDGRSDVAGRLNDGRWYVGRSNGSQFSNEYWGLWDNNLTWLDVLLDDFAP